MRTLLRFGAWCLLSALSTTPAWADTLATGDATTLLNMDDGFISGLSQPTAMAFLPDGRIVVTEKAGAVKLFGADGVAAGTAGTLTVDTASEKGLLNVLVHPDFATNRLLFFYYSAANGGTAPPMGTGGGTNASRHRVVSIRLGETNLLEMATQKVLLEGLRGPANHDGGAMTILGDKLFVGTGDTGSNSQSPPSAMRVTNYAGTCLTDANGKVLRINLDGSIPSDNPLVGKAASACGASAGTAPGAATMTGVRTEIFAWGFRNVWRLWGDPKTGNLWVGEVGEITYEEINIVPPTGNKHYGWPFREGNEGMPASQCASIAPNVGDCVDPVYFCEHSDRSGSSQPDNPNVPNDCSSITGGVILDGCEWPSALQGRYVFGDYESKQNWTLAVNAARDGIMGARAPLFTGEGSGVVQWVEHGGALYAVMFAGTGHVTRLVPKTPEAACPGGGGMGGNGAGGAASGGAASGGAASGGAASGGVAGEGSGGSPSAGESDGGATAGGGPASNGGSASGARGGTPGAGGTSSSAGSGGRANAGTPGTGGSTPSADSDDGGCGCRLGGNQTGSLAALAAALGLSFFVGRRRRRRQ